MICSGVKSSPHGMPHHPNATEVNVAPSFDFTPHDRQQISGRLFIEVMTSADHTVCDTWTSIGPGPPHFGQSP